MNLLQSWDNKFKAWAEKKKEGLEKSIQETNERKRNDTMYNNVSRYLNLKADTKLPAKKEYRNLTFEDSMFGRNTMEHEIKNYASVGWRVSGMSSSSQGYNVGKTIVLGAVFLPFALAGKKANKVYVVMERDGEDPNVLANKQTYTPRNQEEVESY